ncbi:MAG: hypothetical protein UR89_C0043G0006 [Candidatus Roizmanbacteria bacterium GW2011_GWA2_35_8]|uniref:Uncharacterized protein n=1 Tax=Candidatus Roizmanbacteria bacterium GW2011_GWA2_35_8 TaxID=1618479 RepID=A0A0G0DAY4_9BACT|nr:MAG: hypothetical protein UR89_C0043G0006 [Candidatus Roizmanbacteria bacterium GW2011_GWA2_35_8]
MKMTSSNHVIIIPGLGNGVVKHVWATNSWKKFGIIPHVFDAKWKVEENGFQPKLERALKLVDRDRDWPWMSFNQATKSSPSFRESVLRAQKLEKTLTKHDRQKILTLRPWLDETVPYFTVPIEGARNEIVPSIEHVVSIALNMIIYKKRIIDFILK